MILGVVGFISSGKSSVADYLIEQHNFKRVAFADPLKDAVADIFGWKRDMLEGDTKASRDFREKADPWWSERFGFDVTPRWALQKMGTEAGRDVFHTNLWVLAAEKRMQDKNQNYVISDVRFPNEVKFVQDLGGKVIRVKRGPEPDWYPYALGANALTAANEVDTTFAPFMKETGVHFSEWAWVGSVFDYVINNDGSLLDLKERTENVYFDMKIGGK
jgi:hypothetical protein